MLSPVHGLRRTYRPLSLTKGVSPEVRRLTLPSCVLPHHFNHRPNLVQLRLSTSYLVVHTQRMGSEEKRRPRVGRDGFGVTRCWLGGRWTLVSTRFLLNSTSPARFPIELDPKQQSQEGQTEGKKAGLRLLSVFGSSSVRRTGRRDKVGVGGEIHVGSHSLSAE